MDTLGLTLRGGRLILPQNPSRVNPVIPRGLVILRAVDIRTLTPPGGPPTRHPNPRQVTLVILLAPVTLREAAPPGTHHSRDTQRVVLPDIRQRLHQGDPRVTRQNLVILQEAPPVIPPDLAIRPGHLQNPKVHPGPAPPAIRQDLRILRAHPAILQAPPGIQHQGVAPGIQAIRHPDLAHLQPALDIPARQSTKKA